jgi:uncharacterized protein (TIRG00374 family)
MDIAQRNRTFRIVQFAAGIAVGILLCYDLGRQADFRQIARSIKSEQLLWILMGLLSVSATIGIRAMRWRILLAPAAPQTRSVDLVGPIVAGQMLNAILPIRGGDLVRAYLAGRKGPENSFYAFGTIVAEKLLDVLLWLVLLAFVLSWVSLPPWLISGARYLLLIPAVLSLLFILSRLFPRLYRDMLNKSGVSSFLTRRLTDLWHGIVVLRRPETLVPALLWSALLWAAYAFNTWAILRALNMGQGWTAALLVLVVLQAGNMPPSTPARIGVFEYLCVFSLALLGVERNTGLAYGMILHIIVLVPPLICWWVIVIQRQCFPRSEANR